MAAEEQNYPSVRVFERPLNSNVNQVPTVTAYAAFIGLAEQGPTLPTLVGSWSEFLTLFGTSYTDLHRGVFDYYTNGGRWSYIQRLYSPSAVAATLNVYELGAPVPPDAGAVAIMSVQATNPGTWGNELRLGAYARENSAGRFDLSLFRVPASAGSPSLANRANQYLVEQWADVTFDPDDERYVFNVINGPSNTGSQFIRVTYAVEIPTGHADFPMLPAFSTEPAPFAGGVGNGAWSPTTTDWSNAVNSFDSVPGPYILNLPGYFNPTVLSAAITSAAVRGDVFVVLDSPSPADFAANATGGQSYTDYVLQWLANFNSVARADLTYGAAYTPYLNMPVIGASNAKYEMRPPGGAVVGMMTALDAGLGVWRAPAGIQAGVLSGAISAERRFKDSELSALNNAYVNAIRPMVGVGVTVMGARTLKKFGIDRYINVRRLLIDIKKRLSNSTEYALFANNDNRLWVELTGTCSRILSDLWAQGGLKGSSVQEAFYVKCDQDNNTPATIEAGEVHIEVGVALATPAEFIVISIGHFDGSTAVSETV